MTVIALILIGTLLIVLNVNAIKKEKRSFSSTLKNEEENMADYQVEIGKFRREFSETILELQKEIESLRNKEIGFKAEEVLKQEKNKYENNLLDINDSFGNRELMELIHENLNTEELSRSAKRLKRNSSNKDVRQDTDKEIKGQDYIVESNEVNVKNTEEILEKGEVLEREEVSINSDENKNVDKKLNSEDKVDENNKGNTPKINEIKNLLDVGLSIEEIAEKIGIGKGEVLLIKDLYVK